MGLTDNPAYCPYHRLLGHTIERCYVVKDIIENMFNNGEIEIKGLKSKTSVNMVTVEKSAQTPASSENFEEGTSSEGIPTVSLPPMAIPVEFQTANGIQIVWAYPEMPKARPDLPTLYEVVTCPSLPEMFPHDDSDDDGSEWQKCKRRSDSRSKSAPKSKVRGVRMIGRPPQKKRRKGRRRKRRERSLSKILMRNMCNLSDFH